MSNELPENGKFYRLKESPDTIFQCTIDTDDFGCSIHMKSEAKPHLNTVWTRYQVWYKEFWDLFKKADLILHE